MYYALIKNEFVQNIIVADDEFVKLIEKDWDEIVYVPDYDIQGIAIGFQYVNSEFINPNPPIIQEEPT